MAREQLVLRILREFDELRGLKLTMPQAQRLFGLRPDVCERVLNSLTAQGRLLVNKDHLYVLKQSA